MNNNIQVCGDHKVSIFRKFQNDNLKSILSIYENINSVLNIGALPNDGDKEGNYYKNYFSRCDYYTLDKNKNQDVPKHYNFDLHDLSKINKKFDLVLLMSVLEHLENPFICSKEIYNIISTNGYLYIAAPFFYPIHKEKAYSDYWRFTDEGIRTLFKDLTEIWIRKMDSVILSVEDRNRYWDTDSTPAGYCALFRKE